MSASYSNVLPDDRGQVPWWHLVVASVAGAVMWAVVIVLIWSIL